MTDLEQLLKPVWGYFELGMFPEANDEIENLPPVVKTSKEVMSLRAHISQELGDWEILLKVGGYLVRTWPEESQHWIWLACGTRLCRSLEEAERVLLDALALHSSEPMIHYTLACYATQLGTLEVARLHLTHAIDLDPEVRLMLMRDPELEPLWASLGETPPPSD